MAINRIRPGIAVIGSGSMGSLFSARLSSSADVTMIGSWLNQIESVNRQGLTIIDPNGARSVHNIKAVSDGSEVGEVNYVLVMVKGWQTGQAARTAKKILPLDGLALTLQNGIGNLEKIAAQVGWQRSAQGVTSEGASMVEPGVVRHGGYGSTYLSAVGETASRIKEIGGIFEHAGFETNFVDDAKSLIWGKLAVNAGINPLTALLQVPNGFLVERKEARNLMESAAEETAEVAKIQDIALPYPDAAQRALQVARETASNISSMAQDIARGTPTEIDSITKPIVEIGQTYGISTPVNEALLFLMKQYLQDGEWHSNIDHLPEAVRANFKTLIQ